MTWSPPEPSVLYDAIDATWAPHAVETQSPFVIRHGAGGGKRVSAASLGCDAAASPDDIARASARMVEIAQRPLFMVRDQDAALDEALGAEGFDIVAPTISYAAKIDDLADRFTGDLAAIPCERPLAIQKKIWAEGDINAARLNVMHRTNGPKTHLLGRIKDTPAGTCFVAIHNGIAMLHALEIAQASRRNGVGTLMTFGAAHWASQHGAHTFALLTTRENIAANALYTGLGMHTASGYHYRIGTE